MLQPLGSVITSCPEFDFWLCRGISVFRDMYGLSGEVLCPCAVFGGEPNVNLADR